MRRVVVAAAGADWFAELYAEHHGWVVSWLTTKTGGDRALAEDLTADTFVRAWKRRESFTGGSAGAWLRVIARNVFLDHVKSARARREVPVGEFGCDDPSDGVTPEQFILDGEAVELTRVAAAAVADHFDGLSDRQATCLRLRHVQGFNVADTARIMGVSVGAVKTLTRRAILNVQTAISRRRVREFLDRGGSVSELATVSGIDRGTLEWIASRAA